MNLVIDDAAEVFVKEAKPRRELGAFHHSSLPNTDSEHSKQVAFSSKATTLLLYSKHHNHHS
jgi:hypothetical protein